MTVTEPQPARREPTRLVIPPHPTCIDVSGIGQEFGTAWLCGPDCPKPREVPPTERTVANLQRRDRRIT